MRTMNVSSFVRRALNDQRGQVLPWVTLMMVSLIGMAGLTIDVGHAYVVKAQLQNSSQAAVMAAAESVYISGATGTAQTLADQYSSSGSLGGVNGSAGQGTVSTTITTPCLNALSPSGSGCTNTNGNASGSSIPNAIKVTQTAKVGTWFMNVLGVPSLNVTSTATATFGTAQPLNVAFILDATPSMANPDPNCKNAPAEQCAMNGMVSMLEALPPCRGGVASCNPTDAVTILRFALFSFPNILKTDVVDDTKCVTPKIQLYSFPTIPSDATGYTDTVYTTASTKNKSGQTIPGTSTDTTYLITQNSLDPVHIDKFGFSSDYYSPTGTNKLNTGSQLVKIMGTGNSDGCMREPNGGSGSDTSNGGSGITYQAGAIYAAQAALMAEQDQTTKLGLNTLNVIVFVSDGQANSWASTFNPSTDTATGGYATMGINGAGKYPDDTQECQQTIAASQFAQNLGTRVYGIAYGSETGGCSTDNKVVVTNTSGLPVNVTKVSQVIPCTIMEDMSSPTGFTDSLLKFYFYGDVTSSKNGCLGNTTTGSGMDSIFQGVLASLTSPRLISNNLS